MSDARNDRTVARLVGGRYRITGLVASGGMGEVYRAEDEVLGRTVALKVLRSNLGADPDFVERFRREAMSAARLSHPAIVQVYDWGRDSSDAYMAMEFIDGQNLREILAAHDTLPPDTSARIAHQVCGALEHARRAGIVHRDIKPENIIITPDGAVKVADFGLARALAESRATQAGVVLGTAAYLAPEQVQGQEVDHRADLYALGCMLFEMLTGRPPFVGDIAAAIAFRRVNEDVPAPSATAPGVPPALDEVVARATARSPDDRYATASEMAAALRAVVPDAAARPLDLDVQQTTAIPMESFETVRITGKKPPKAARTRKQILRRRLVVLLALVALLGTGIPLGLRATARVTVPKLAGAPRDDALARLRNLRLNPTVLPINDPSVAQGRVIRTEPSEGARLRRGAAITLFVSLGPELAEVPDVRGKPYEEAVKVLGSRGLGAEKAEIYDPAKKGTVIAQDPDAPALIAKGRKVKLTVSRGPELVPVPDVRTKSQADATTILEGAGFTVTVTQKESSTVPEGFVIDQSPTGDAKAPKGSAVTIVVSTGTPLAAVPNLQCMTKRQAQDALAAAGFKAAFTGNGKYVVDQDPAPGTMAHTGSTVTARMGSGVFLNCD